MAPKYDNVKIDAVSTKSSMNSISMNSFLATWQENKWYMLYNKYVLYDEYYICTHNQS